MKYDLKTPQSLNPAWWNDLGGKTHDATAENGKIILHGEDLLAKDNITGGIRIIPDGQYKVTLGRTFWAQDLESYLADANQKRLELEAYWKEREDFQIEQKRIQQERTEEFNRTHKFPDHFWFGTKLNSHGLTARSCGNGCTKSTVVHILIDDQHQGQYSDRRVAKPLCGYKSKGWAGNEYAKTTSIPTCKACLRKAEKYKLNESTPKLSDLQ